VGQKKKQESKDVVWLDVGRAEGKVSAGAPARPPVC
jgi:hypothetical protein